MKKEWIMITIIVVVTTVGALGIIRWMAPQLLGISSDLQVVKVAEEIPPFFENIFRAEDFQSKEFIIKDPISGIRAKPLFPNASGMGPNDILGFRNNAVPNIIDVAIIGDSQTYGNNVNINNNWPGHLD